MATDWMKAVQRDGLVLQSLPESLKTPEICFAAVREDGVALQYVPDSLVTPELCKIAVQQDGWALQYVPESLRTPEICLAAVQQDGNALNLVPDRGLLVDHLRSLGGQMMKLLGHNEELDKLVAEVLRR